MPHLRHHQPAAVGEAPDGGGSSQVRFMKRENVNSWQTGVCIDISFSPDEKTFVFK
jgi:hypothetical protein